MLPPAPSDAPATLVNADGSTTTAGYWYGGNNASWTFSLRIIISFYHKQTVQELLP